MVYLDKCKSEMAKCINESVDECDMEESSGEYGVRYKSIDTKDKITIKEKFFATEEAREKFIKKMENYTSFCGVESFIDPDKKVEEAKSEKIQDKILEIVKNVTGIDKWEILEDDGTSIEFSVDDADSITVAQNSEGKIKNLIQSELGINLENSDVFASEEDEKTVIYVDNYGKKKVDECCDKTFKVDGEKLILCFCGTNGENSIDRKKINDFVVRSYQHCTIFPKSVGSGKCGDAECIEVVYDELDKYNKSMVESLMEFIKSDGFGEQKMAESKDARHFEKDGKIYNPINVGDDGDSCGPDMKFCPECKANKGEPHKHGCDMECCPICGKQINTACECNGGVKVNESSSELKIVFDYTVKDSAEKAINADEFLNKTLTWREDGKNQEASFDGKNKDEVVKKLSEMGFNEENGDYFIKINESNSSSGSVFDLFDSTVSEAKFSNEIKSGFICFGVVLKLRDYDHINESEIGNFINDQSQLLKEATEDLSEAVGIDNLDDCKITDFYDFHNGERHIVWAVYEEEDLLKKLEDFEFEKSSDADFSDDCNNQ